METMDPKTFWIESLFDVNESYLYVLVLPALALFALGFRSQAALFGLGAALYFTLANTLRHDSVTEEPPPGESNGRGPATSCGGQGNMNVLRIENTPASEIMSRRKDRPR